MVYISLYVSGLWSQVTVLNGVSNYGLDDVSCRSKQIDSLQLLWTKNSGKINLQKFYKPVLELLFKSNIVEVIE